MTKVLSLRVDDDLADWATLYAETRGVTRQALLEEGLRSFKADCEAGVPEIRERARAVSSIQAQPSDGVGVCPKRADGKGHVWAHPRVDPVRSCTFGCGTHGREPDVPGEDGKGYLAVSGRERAEFFSTLKAPMQNGTGDPRKATR